MKKTLREWRHLAGYKGQRGFSIDADVSQSTIEEAEMMRPINIHSAYRILRFLQRSIDTDEKPQTLSDIVWEIRGGIPQAGRLRLADLRNQTGLSLVRVAQEMGGIDYKTIHRTELGQAMSRTTIARLLAFYNDRLGTAYTFEDLTLCFDKRTHRATPL